MQPLIEGLKQAVFAVLDENGIPHTFTDIPVVSELKEETDATCKYSIDTFDSSAVVCTFIFRNKRGMMDVLCGRKTKAAGRYIRYSKRWKEKRRRERLKGTRT